jgi:hypothetical protein
MSTRNKFLAAIAVMLALVLFAEYRMPQKFQWRPTFAHNDAQPFGCQLLDSLLTLSMPQGYTVERRTLWQLDHDSVFQEPKAVLIITDEDVDNQIKKVLELAQRGNIMILAISDVYRWCDTLGCDYFYNGTFQLSDVAGKKPEKGRLSWENDTLWQLPVYDQLIARTLSIPDSVRHEVLARYLHSGQPDVFNSADGFIEEDTVAVDALEEEDTVAVDALEEEDTVAVPEDSVPDLEGQLSDDEESDPADNNPWRVVAASFPVGKGKLVLVSAPLLMTNYTMLSGDGSVLIGRIMSQAGSLPVIRTVSYMSATAQTEETPFYVFLKEPSLRWAVYLSMITLILFCIFTARRRQRVIPVIQRPQNGNLEFVRLIGTLYWQEHDNAGLLRRKLTYTAEDIRRQVGIDILSEDHADEAISLLASHTGMETEQMRLVLRNIKQAASGNYAVSDAELKTFVNLLDQLLHSL